MVFHLNSSSVNDDVFIFQVPCFFETFFLFGSVFRWFASFEDSRWKGENFPQSTLKIVSPVKINFRNPSQRHFTAAKRHRKHSREKQQFELLINQIFPKHFKYFIFKQKYSGQKVLVICIRFDVNGGCFNVAKVRIGHFHNFHYNQQP